MARAITTFGQRRRITNAVMTSITATCALFVTVILLLIISYIAVRGLSSLSVEFLVGTPKPVGEGGGIGNAIAGSAMMTLLAGVIGLPVGIAAGVYLAEYGRNWFGNTVRFVADTLIGIPSIIIGIFVYTLVVLPMGRQSGLAGGLALAIIMLPIVARTTEEMIKLVPNSMPRRCPCAWCSPMACLMEHRSTRCGIGDRDRRNACDRTSDR